MEDKSGEETSLGSVVKELLQNSSAHGLPNIYQNKSRILRVLWAILFFGGVGAVVCQVSLLFMNFISAPYQVGVEIRFERNISFPAITVCNVNPVLKTKLEKSSDRFRSFFDTNFVPPGSGPGVPGPSVPENPGNVASKAEGSTTGANVGSGGNIDSTTIAPGPSGPTTPNVPGPSGPVTTNVAGPGGPASTNAATSGEPTTTNVPGGSGPGGPGPGPGSGTGRRRRDILTPASDSNSITAIEQSTEALLSWDEKESQDFFGTMSDEYKKQQMLIVMLANKTLEERIELGHQIDDMLLSCEWKGYPCSPKNFTNFYHYKYGNCYTFNSNMFGQDNKLNTYRPGPLYGLNLELYAQQNEYMHGITTTAGFKVVIHNANEMPFPEEQGISISPGFETSIGIKVIDIERLGTPWGDCVTSMSKNSEFEDFYEDNYGVVYTMKTCERSCYQWEVVEKCGCADPKYPISRNSSIEVCSLTGDIADLELVACVHAVDQQYLAGELDCEKKCPLACFERGYIPAISLNTWPSDAYGPTLMERMMVANAEMRKQMLGSSPLDWTKKNVARVLIYFQEFNYEYIKQSPSYGIIDLASDIGGQLGLWIGVSILTLCEMVQYVGVIMVFLFRKMFRCGENRVNGSVSKTPVRDLQPKINSEPDLPSYSPPPSYNAFT